MQIIETGKRTLGSLALNSAAGYFAQTFNASKAETKS